NLFDQSINQCKITKNLSQNVVHSDSDLILHNSSVLIDKEPNNHSPFTMCHLVAPIDSYALILIDSC
ncbi:hypothetical protein FIU53_13280, partial [Enterococcus faecium]